MSYLAYLLKCENPIHCEQFHGFITCSCGFFNYELISTRKHFWILFNVQLFFCFAF